MEEAEKKCLWPGWETVRLIGSGSFGAVYEISRTLPNGKVEKAALKVISIPQNSGDVDELYGNGYDDASITAHFKSYLADIVNEYSLMSEIKGHTNVVCCDDIRYVQHADGFGWDIFLKMELLTPLYKVRDMGSPEDMALRLGQGLCSALVLCKEKNIIHRDIKPQNIFMSEHGDFKLGDFGIAKTIERTTGGTKIGTYGYMAPEVYNNQPYGTSADIYSLGLVMYWLLNERRLPFLPMPPKVPSTKENEQARLRRFQGEPLPAPAHGSEGLQRIVLKACAFDPKDRYHMAEEMLRDLTALQSGSQPVQSVPPQSAEQQRQTDEIDDSTVGVFGSNPVFAEAPKHATGQPMHSAQTEQHWQADDANEDDETESVSDDNTAAEDNSVFNTDETVSVFGNVADKQTPITNPEEFYRKKSPKKTAVKRCIAVVIVMLCLAGGFFFAYHDPLHVLMHLRTPQPPVSVQNSLNVDADYLFKKVSCTLEWTCSPFGKVEEWIISYYDDAEKLFKQAVFNSTGSEALVYWYDENGDTDDYAEFKFSEKGYRTYYRAYDANGNLTWYEEIEISEDGIVTCRDYESGVLVCSTEEWYNENGNRIRSYFYNANGEFTGSRKYEHDVNGNETCSFYYDEKGTLESSDEYVYDENGEITEYNEYTYDESGNKTLYRTLKGEQEVDQVITVAASPTPHAEILKEAAKVLEKDGWTLDVKEYSDYVVPNNVVEDGEVDANYFQHQPYLDTFNKENNTHLVSVAQVHYEPFGIYAGTKSSIEELEDGDMIAIPNDGSNRARALFLLEANGIITLKEGADMDATKMDITENPLNLEIVEMEAAQVSGVRDSVALAVINGNYALAAGLNAGTDAIATEDPDSVSAQTYANVLVVKEGNENSEKITALKKALLSDEVRTFINETYSGAVVPLF